MSDILSILSRLTDWQNLLDVGLVNLLFFLLLRLFSGTQAVQLFRGLLLIWLAIFVITRTVELTAFSWLVSSSSIIILVAIPVIFQPELRSALEKVGRGSLPFFGRKVNGAIIQHVISAIVHACAQLADNRHGALIVLEGATRLEGYIDRGVSIDSKVSPELLLTIFLPTSALRDGAVIMSESRVAAAGCVLPFTFQDSLDSQLGTRHRAAIGITEQSDALSIVISQETGTISVARNGRIVRQLDEYKLQRILTEFFDPRNQPIDDVVENIPYAE